MSRLVLSRYAGQTILIRAGNQRIRITVTEIADSQIKLAIDCPRAWNVVREERDRVEASVEDSR